MNLPVFMLKFKFYGKMLNSNLITLPGESTFNTTIQIIVFADSRRHTSLCTDQSVLTN